MKPCEMTNDLLAQHIELWMELEKNLTDGQKDFFREVLWRLRLTFDFEEERKNENG